MKACWLIVCFTLFWIKVPARTDSLPASALAARLWLAVKQENPHNGWLDQLARLSPERLPSPLYQPNAATAFWLNIYNAFTALSLRENPAAFRKRGLFFRQRIYRVAGRRLSLDDIEHGLLRASRIKWSMGYLRKPFVARWEKTHRLYRIDFRIHFALNCGAASCPPIAFYESARLDQQLQVAQRVYLRREVSYDTARNTVRVPVLLNWFRADFGGKQGILHLLRREGLIPSGPDPRVKWKPYDWTLMPGPFN
jgi:hypothetical protein